MVVVLAILAVLFWRIGATDIRERLVYLADLVALAVVRVALLFVSCLSSALGLWCWLGNEVAAGTNGVASMFVLPVSVWGAESLFESLLCAVVLMLFMGGLGVVASRVAGRSLLGSGDVKLYGACCLFLDIQSAIIFVWLSAFTGLGMAIWALAVRKSRTFAFAPAIVIACWLAVAGSSLSLW